MMLAHTIQSAKTEHVVYFLVSAYVNAMYYQDTIRCNLPAPVKHLPLRGKRDLERRLSTLRALREHRKISAPAEQRLLAEAIDVFVAASYRLSAFDRVGKAPEVK